MAAALATTVLMILAILGIAEFGHRRRMAEIEHYHKTRMAEIERYHAVRPDRI